MTLSTYDSSRQPHGGLPLLIITLLIAAVVWFFLFAVPGTPFWVVISAATFTLGATAVVAYPDTFSGDAKSWLMFTVYGIISAAVLYLIFYVGNIIVSYLPFGPDQVEAVYGTKSQAEGKTILGLLLFPVGPGEELFWRSLVQRHLMQKLGTWKGFGLSLLLYAGVHIPSMNLTLLAAATIAGAVWGLMYIYFKHVGPGIISHAAWDAAIFILFPLV